MILFYKPFRLYNLYFEYSTVYHCKTCIGRFFRKSYFLKEKPVRRAMENGKFEFAISVLIAHSSFVFSFVKFHCFTYRRITHILYLKFNNQTCNPLLSDKQYKDKCLVQPLNIQEDFPLGALAHVPPTRHHLPSVCRLQTTTIIVIIR